MLTLVQRSGVARSFHVDSVSMADILPIVRQNVARESSIMTDDATRYKKLGEEFASHESVTTPKANTSPARFTPTPSRAIIRCLSAA